MTSGGSSGWEGWKEEVPTRAQLLAFACEGMPCKAKRGEGDGRGARARYFESTGSRRGLVCIGKDCMGWFAWVMRR